MSNFIKMRTIFLNDSADFDVSTAISFRIEH